MLKEAIINLKQTVKKILLTFNIQKTKCIKGKKKGMKVFKDHDQESERARDLKYLRLILADDTNITIEMNQTI